MELAERVHAAVAGIRARKIFWIGVLVATATVAVYLQVLGHTFVNYDDPVYILDNPYVAQGLSLSSLKWAFTTSYAANWHPLTWLSLFVDASIFGIRPAPFLFTNLLLHVANTCLLLGILRRATGTTWRSALVAALFALHPLHVESVAWASERKDVLCTFFGFLCILAYVRYVQLHRRPWYGLAVGTMALSLMAKPMLVTLPGILLLLDYWPLNRYGPAGETPDSCRAKVAPRNGWQRFVRLAVEKWPFLVLSIMSVILTLHAQSRGGAVRSFDRVSLVQRAQNSAQSYATYLEKAVWPRDLCVFYPYPESFRLPHTALLLAVAMGVTCLVVLWLRRFPYVAVGWSWYVGTLLPVIGFIQVGGQALADRYTYVPLIGIFIVVAWGICEAPVRWRRAATGATLVVLLALTMATWRQISYWKNSESLFRHTLDVMPYNHVANNNLGVQLLARNQLDEAFPCFVKAVAVKPTFAEAHANLGIVYGYRGNFESALEHFGIALRSNPRNADAWFNSGVLMARLGRLAEAEGHFRETTTLRPTDLQARYALALLLHGAGRDAEASEQALVILRLKPDHRDGLALLDKLRPQVPAGIGGFEIRK
ncbi:MAG: tetratricopeptide repeat protein [Candidatus Hydrogenedentes bacterium]|nr:tetratricopeptide repeat protein [Candidatus Hydrogenedentota bacterium]